MMKLSKIALLALLALSILPSPLAHAFLRVGLLGGMNIGKMTGYEHQTGSTNGIGFLGGPTVDLRVGPISIEGGVIYGTRNYSFSQRTGDVRDNTDFHSQVLEFPVMARFWIGDMFGIGAGPYFANFLSDLSRNRVVKNYDNHRSIENDERRFLDSKTSGPYDSFNRKTHEYGAVVSAQFAYPMVAVGKDSRSVGILDVRYLYGISDNTADTSIGDSSKTRELEILLGAAFML